jgi:two-component sensor histidine kinase
MLFSPGGGRLELRLVERTFQMNSERCWRLGLIVSELVTNAECHAFRNGGGLIRVELLPSLSFIECRVTDNGAGEANTCPGHGLNANFRSSCAPPITDIRHFP